MEKDINGRVIELVLGDITRQDVDAVVNAANPSLLGGGGVDGAIHSAGGPSILAECRAIREAKGECPPGEAVVTGGGHLRARRVIHAVGPVYSHYSAAEARRLLRSAYETAVALAVENRCASLAFPALSTGIYG